MADMNSIEMSHGLIAQNAAPRCVQIMIASLTTGNTQDYSTNTAWSASELSERSAGGAVTSQLPEPIYAYSWGTYWAEL